MLGRCPVFSERLCGDCGSLPDNKRIIPDNKLEKTLCKIVDRVGVKISDRDNESYHDVGSQSRAIVKFSHRKEFQQLIKVKKDLSKLSLTDADLSNTKIFINQSLCLYYKLL